MVFSMVSTHRVVGKSALRLEFFSALIIDVEVGG
jgi:hypothetical protein